MLSRVAMNIYWMARFIERAENVARLINVNANLLLDLPATYSLGWKPLIEITGNEESFNALYDSFSETSVLRFLTADDRNYGSIISSLSKAREDARTIRDILPRECWESINDLHIHVRGQMSKGMQRNRRYDFMKYIIQSAQQITGQLAGTMTHNHAYHFLRMGRNLERADMTTRIIDISSASLQSGGTGVPLPFETIRWVSVLKSLSGYQMFRQQMKAPVRRDLVLEFLINDRFFPRSFFHCLSEVEDCLNNLPNNEMPVRLVMHAKRATREIDPGALSQEELSDFLDRLQIHLAELNDEISRTYFAAEVYS